MAPMSSSVEKRATLTLLMIEYHAAMVILGHGYIIFLFTQSYGWRKDEMEKYEMRLADMRKGANYYDDKQIMSCVSG
jgi:hypothetical protein